MVGSHAVVRKSDEPRRTPITRIRPWTPRCLTTDQRCIRKIGLDGIHRFSRAPAPLLRPPRVHANVYQMRHPRDRPPAPPTEAPAPGL